MAKYFFHLRDGTDELLDPDGRQLDTLEQCKAEALRAARDTLSQEIRQGIIDLRYHIDVEDERHTVVYSLPLGDSFAVIGAAD